MLKHFDQLLTGTKFNYAGSEYIKLSTAHRNAADTYTGETIHINSGDIVNAVPNAREIHADWLANL